MLLTPSSPSSLRPNSSRSERCDQVMRWGQHMFPKPFPSSCHPSFQEIYSASPSCNLCFDKSQMSSNSFVIERMTPFSGVSRLHIQIWDVTPFPSWTYLFKSAVFFCIQEPDLGCAKIFSLIRKWQINHQKEVPCFLSDVFIHFLLVLYMTSGISWTHECWLSYHVFLGQSTIGGEWQWTRQPR